MDKKDIQTQRKKRYFIEACKKLIDSKGIEKLTVKDISNEAGYATGTLYNYFKNLNVLLFNCVKDYFSELYDYLLKIECIDDNYDQFIKALMDAYVSFFIERPEVYHLIYLKDLGSVEELSTDKKFRPRIIHLLMDALVGYYKKEDVDIDRQELKIIGALITNSLHGNLLFYFNNKSNVSVEALKKKIKTEVGYIVKKGGK